MLLMLDTMMIDRKIENIGFSNKTWVFFHYPKKRRFRFSKVYIYISYYIYIYTLSVWVLNYKQLLHYSPEK